ncbi:hypothetical protein FA13DRAFT_573805 [Coprinellus micaceus]|uniref:Uncharacterized protein n=1 Tax=Coprinellus micaceus TaxID=71717 RepID=A0A4Y7T7L4_COPMI|nr:hypothetical protein FA13DRAFT_573805 [Coprinellus micaceus]
MDHHSASNVPQVAPGTRPRQHSTTALNLNPPHNHRPDPPFTNQHLTPRPHLARGYGSYQGGSSSNPSAQLYPVHIQSLAPRSFPGTSQPPRNPMEQRISYQPSAIQTHRTATLPNQLPPHQRAFQHNPPYAPHQATLPPSHSHYGSQQPPASAPISGYTPPPSFDFAPPGALQSRMTPAEAQVGHARHRPASLPQGSPPAPEALLPQFQPQMQYSPEPSNQLDIPSQESPVCCVGYG